MTTSYSYIRYHLVFSTKRRRPLLTPEIEMPVHRYMAGVLQNQRGRLIAIGGMPDHLHLLFSLPCSVAISDVVRELKSESSRWVKTEFPGLQDFAWQGGYSIFTVSKSAEDDVISYIANQKGHHHKLSFKEELERLLKKHGVGYQPEHLWDEDT